MQEKKIPTLSEWMGGDDKFQELTKVFYEKVLKDEILEPVFRHMNSEHAKHVADFLCEIVPFMATMPWFMSSVNIWKSI
jgi:hemoglobin